MNSIEDIVLVVVIQDSMVFESFVFVGNTTTIAKLAEEKFIELVYDLHPTILSEDELDIFVEDGYYEFGIGCSLCITWPELCTKRSKPLTAIES